MNATPEPVPAARSTADDAGTQARPPQPIRPTESRVSPRTRPTQHLPVRPYLTNDALAEKQRRSLGWVIVGAISGVVFIVMSLLVLGVIMLYRMGLS